MYRIFTANKKVEKRLQRYINLRKDIKNKLERLKINPQEEIGTHKLHGRLAGKWSAWMGSNIRIIYSIDNLNKKIIIEAVGSHKIY